MIIPSPRWSILDSVFVYPPVEDSVLLVDKDAYDACNTNSFIDKRDDGNTVFTLNRSGPFYFISGVEANCMRNESVVIVVMADRTNRSSSSSSSPPPSPSAASSPPPPPESAEATPAPAPAPAEEEPNSFSTSSKRGFSEGGGLHGLGGVLHWINHPRFVKCGLKASLCCAFLVLLPWSECELLGISCFSAAAIGLIQINYIYICNLFLICHMLTDAL